MKDKNKKLLGILIALVISLFLMISYGFNIQRQTQENRFLVLQQVLMSNQVDVRDSLIKSTRQELDSLRRQLHLYDHEILSERLWLARGIYSETNRPFEQWLVGWVMRNRLEVGYRGCETYKCVVLDPLQFSAFNWNNPSRMYYRNKSITDHGESWISALTVATEVMNADETERPFSNLVTNFYSPTSMNPKWDTPKWALSDSLDYIKLDDVDPDRFKFYAIKNDTTMEND